MQILGLMDIPLWLILLIIIAIALYIYGNQPFSFWSKLGVPCPPPTIFLGNMPEIFQPEGGHTAFARWQAKYGRIHGMYNFRHPLMVVTDLEALKNILVKDFGNFRDRYFLNDGILINRQVRTGLFFVGGDTWKRIRSIVTPTFSSGKLKLFTHHINVCAKRLAQNILHGAESGELIDVKHLFGAFNMDVIVSTAFSVEVDSQSNLEDPFVKHGRSLFSTGLKAKTLFILSAIFPGLSLPLFRALNVGFFKREDMNFYDKVMHKMIEERKQSPSETVDFLQLLINAETDSPELVNKEGRKLTSTEIVGQGLTFFIAGYETASTTLQFIAYELARHQDVQQKVVDEIDCVIGKTVEPTYEHCMSLKYLDAVINETLRMYPPLSQITRLSQNDVTIKGYPLPAGTGILIPLYNIARDPEYFPDPNTFNPSRFVDMNVFGAMTVDSTFSGFFPFGYGPRLCVGMRLAVLELKMALIHVLRRTRFVKSVPHEVGLVDLTSLLLPDQPIMLLAEPRD